MQRLPLACLFLSIHLCLFSCREETTSDRTMTEEPDESGEPSETMEPLPSQTDDGPPNNAPRVFPSPPENDDDTAEYATDLLLIADCEPFPPILEVAHNAVFHGSCDNMTVIPVMNQDGDTFEVAAPFTWSVDDPAVIGLDFPLGPANNLARAYGLSDAFDAGGFEPQTVLTACAQNVCPDPPTDCSDEICVQLPVVSIVSVDGSWLLTGYGYDGDIVELLQHGRQFTDLPHGIKRGRIDGTTVSFESGDYRYDGEMAPDRQAMSGTVTDLIGLGPAGSWFAVRE